MDKNEKLNYFFGSFEYQPSDNIIINKMASATLKNCSICDEKLNKSTHKPIVCKGCDEGIIACKTCVKKYMLTSITLLPQCMNCRTEWSDEFIAESIDRTFISGEYKKHLKEVVLEREMSKMPATMPIAEKQKKIDVIEDIRKKWVLKRNELRNQLREVEAEIITCINAVQAISITHPSQKAEKIEYDVKCPNPTDCRGIMSRNKCGLCNIKTCGQCLEISGFTKEEQDAHICKPENIESAKLIKKEAKPCPKCGIPICKIDGCDQMWCPATGCDTAFSWRTGQIDYGRRHNPHYYQRQRELAVINGQGAPPREPGDILCGGLCGMYEMRQIFNRYNKCENKEEINQICEILSNLHRKVNHFTEILLPQARTLARNSANLQNHRVDYLLDKITKEKLNDLAMRAMTVHNKNIKIVDLYELICVSGRELFSHLISCGKSGNEFIAEIKKKIQEFSDLRMYCNIEFAKISITYGVLVPYIRKNFDEKSKKYKKNDAENNYESVNNPAKNQKPLITVSIV